MITCASFGQGITKVSLHRADPARLCINDRFSKELAYYQLDTLIDKPLGLLVLLPGLGELPFQVFAQSALAMKAARAGIVTIVPSLNSRVYLDSPSRIFLDEVIRAALTTHNIAGNKVVMGGFSAGGHLALAYTQVLYKDSLRTGVRPRAVFGIDPAVDLTNLWERAKRMTSENRNEAIEQEGERILRSLKRAFGGSPQQYPQKYTSHSPFTASSPGAGNAQYLVSVPVRIYCEPDLDFWRQFSLEYKDLNAESAGAMISFLQQSGNNQAQFIKTTGKGFRGTTRFPHAWSIVDAAECIDWLQHHLR